MIARAPLLLALCAASAAAQPVPERGADGGAAATLERLADAMRDAARALSDSATPWAEGLGALLANPGAYEPPVTLPNGDILIRRRPDETPPGDMPRSAPLPGDDAPALDPDQPALDL